MCESKSPEALLNCTISTNGSLFFFNINRLATDQGSSIAWSKPVYCPQRHFNASHAQGQCIIRILAHPPGRALVHRTRLRRFRPSGFDPSLKAKLPTGQGWPRSRVSRGRSCGASREPCPADRRFPPLQGWLLAVFVLGLRSGLAAPLPSRPSRVAPGALWRRAAGRGSRMRAAPAPPVPLFGL